jgi:shikimate dehydrogenase
MTSTRKAALRAGVIGWPVAHSLSPEIHRYWLRHYGIEGAYDPIAVAPTDIERFLADLRGHGYCGANVTVPYKVHALRAAKRVTETARRIGAVNTLYFENGALVGTNTDAEGFYRNLQAVAPDWSATLGPAVVLGAGGAARAVVVALADAGAPVIRLINRTREKAEALRELAPDVMQVVDWEARESALSGARLLVNTTSLGMVGQPPLTVDLEHLPREALVYDIVYRPLETDLLALARARGNKVVEGLGMLLFQARPGFRLWFGREPELTDELRRIVLEAAA